MIPSPVWKSSYRLIFGESGQPTLEGWAIVDNTTGDDWTNVRLALVSGRPISFISQLYQPRYVGRPTAELPEEQALAPVVDTGALDELKDQAMSAGWRSAAECRRSGRRGRRRHGSRLRREAGQAAPAAPNPFFTPSAGLAMQEGVNDPSPAPSPKPPPPASSASSSNTASPLPSPSAKANPPCCRSCKTRSPRASC